MSEQFLKLADVLERYSLSASCVYTQIKRGQFPEPVRIGAAVRWRRSTLDAFDDSLPQGINRDFKAGRRLGSTAAVPKARRDKVPA